MTHLRLISGDGDVVDAIEALLDRAKAGEIDGVVLVEIGDRHGRPASAWSWAHRDDIAVAWARLLAAVAATQHELLTDGLE